MGELTNFTWQSGAVTIGTGNYVRRYTTSAETVFPPLATRLLRLLSLHQFSLSENNIHLTRVTETDKPTTYGLTGSVTLKRAGLRMVLSFATAEQPSIEFALRRCSASASLHTNWRIPLGRGQKKLALRVAQAVERKLKAEIGRLPNSLSGITIRLATRGGRGGYKQKTARYSHTWS